MVFYSALQLEFEAVGAGGKNTHIAVDDIFLSAHPCEDQGLYQPKIFRLVRRYMVQFCLFLLLFIQIFVKPLRFPTFALSW